MAVFFIAQVLWSLGHLGAIFFDFGVEHHRIFLS